MKSYFRSWFVFQWTMIILASGSQGTTVLRATRFARFLKLLRLTKFQVMFYQILQRIDNPYVRLALRLVVYLLCLCAFIHVSGSVWFAVGEADETGWVYQYGGIFATWVLSYVGSCHWAVTQMQGSAEIMPGNFRERAVSALHYQMCIIVVRIAYTFYEGQRP